MSTPEQTPRRHPRLAPPAHDAPEAISPRLWGALLVDGAGALDELVFHIVPGLEALYEAAYGDFFRSLDPSVRLVVITPDAGGEPRDRAPSILARLDAGLEARAEIVEVEGPISPWSKGRVLVLCPTTIPPDPAWVERVRDRRTPAAVGVNVGYGVALARTGAQRACRPIGASGTSMMGGALASATARRCPRASYAACETRDMGRRRSEARKRNLAERWRGRAVAPSTVSTDPVETLIARSRRARQHGDERRALVLLRHACVLDEWRARSWTLLGVALARAGSVVEAHQALNHARWLRARTGEGARANVTARLAARLVADAA